MLWKSLLDEQGLPENQDHVWIVELVLPPGAYVARPVPRPVDEGVFNREIAESAEALRKGLPRNRFLLYTTYTEQWARDAIEDLIRLIPNPQSPMGVNDLFSIQAVISAPR